MSTPITEADILSQVVTPERADLSPELARSILDLKFSRTAVERMNELADKNKRGVLTDTEREEMEKYIRVGSFLDLMQAKARLSLQNADSTE